jgi:hypothetical protein
MNCLTQDQIESIIDWMNSWEQLKDTIIPIRFREDFEYEVDLYLTVPYLMKMHPKLTLNEAYEYLEFCKSHTIYLKGCYGHGQIMYPKWQEFKALAKVKDTKSDVEQAEQRIEVIEGAKSVQIESSLITKNTAKHKNNNLKT